MYLQLGQDPLGMMTGGVSADFERARDGLIGLAFGQELGYVDLALREPESLLQSPVTYLSIAVRKGKFAVLFSELVPQLPELANRAAQLVDQEAIATAEVGER